jgi:hypothetical protein
MEKNESTNIKPAAEGDASELSGLLSCPCGRPIDDIFIADAGQGGKWAWVSGNCCGEWSIEFRTQYNALDSEECKKLAIAAWNEAPRAR